MEIWTQVVRTGLENCTKRVMWTVLLLLGFAFWTIAGDETCSLLNGKDGKKCFFVYCCPVEDICCGGGGCCNADETCCGIYCCRNGRKCCNRECQNSCGVPCATSIPNGLITTDATCKPVDGDTCSFTCDAGYTANGTAISCGDNGEWEGNILARCNSNTGSQCTYEIINGKLNSTCRRHPQDTCSYTCDNGYKATSSDLQVTCGGDNQWSRDPRTVCEVILCPEDLAHVHLGLNCTRRVNITCDYSCSDRYKETGLGMSCKPDGTWDLSGGGYSGELKFCSKVSSGSFRSISVNVLITSVLTGVVQYWTYPAI